MGKKKKQSSMAAKAKKRAQERESSGQVSWIQPDDDVEFFNPKKGTNKFDILPYKVSIDDHPEMEKGELWYQKTVWVHYGIGMDEKTVTCPLKTFGNKCPICEHRAQLMKDPDAEDEEIARLKPKQREIFNVRVKGEIQLFTTSYHNFGEYLEEELREDEDDEFGSFAELKGGKTLKVRFRLKKWQANKFLQASKIDFIDRKDLNKSILKKVQDLDAIVIVLDYDELEALFLELEDEESSSKKKKKENKKKKSSSKKKEKEDDEDEDDEDDEDEDDEDEDDEDDDDEDDEDDDEDDEDDEDDDDEDDDDEDDEDDEEECDECPYDHEFGVDTNETDDCEDCECWDNCEDAHEAMKKENKKKKSSSKKKSKKKKNN